MPRLIGEGINRLDARVKVTGVAKYTGDFDSRGTLHIALVHSQAPGGRVRTIHSSTAAKASGVVGVMTHENAPRLQPVACLRLLQDEVIWYAGQPVAIVAAQTVTQARRAAALVQVEYDALESTTADFQSALDKAFDPPEVLGEPASSVRGDPDGALRTSGLTRVDARYTTPTHVHSPLEPHVATVAWEDDRVTVYTATSGLFAAREIVASAFGLPIDRVRVIGPLLGGGFCAKGSAWWPCLLLAVCAARLYRRPVRLELTREQMFTLVGNRQRTIQHVTAAADADGRLVALRHEVISETGAFQPYSETTAFATRIVYACPNVAVRHRVVTTRTPQPLPMRGPGEGPGSFALECALDELAEKLSVDPLELRLRNWAARDQHAGRPWSSNSLRECLLAGANAFGWSRRPRPRTMRDGDWLIGCGMASSYYPGFRAPAAARVRLHDDGTIELECGNQEIGTGACTVMTQALAELLQVSVDVIQVRSGDTSLPETPMAGGAKSTASVIPAVEAAGMALQEKINALEGRSGEDAAARLRRAGLRFVEAEGRSSAQFSKHHTSLSVNTFGACYAEVRIDPQLGQVRVTRLTAAYAAGRIMNAKLARSQLIGGLVFGIGMALHEKLAVHPRQGLASNRSFTDYLLPVHADVPAVDVHLVEEEDPHVPSGVKGIGMNGAVGTAAAIANAVYDATGVRVRDLPIVPETLMK